MDETLTWRDFYEIEKTEEGYKVADIEDWCYLATCDTYEKALWEVERIFEGLKKIWE